MCHINFSGGFPIMISESSHETSYLQWRIWINNQNDSYSIQSMSDIIIHDTSILISLACSYCSNRRKWNFFIILGIPTPVISPVLGYRKLHTYIRLKTWIIVLPEGIWQINCFLATNFSFFTVINNIFSSQNILYSTNTFHILFAY